MAFDQSVITSAGSTRERGVLYVWWTSTAPAGTWYQVYIGRKLRWSGRKLGAAVPAPPRGEQVDVGAVGADERDVDFSASLPAPPSDRVTLSWQGGVFLGADLAGFRVYGQSGFGSGGFGSGGFGMGSEPLAEIVAYTSGVASDGFGSGGFGSGGFGAAAGSYRWTSGPLAAGDWTFAVVPFDAAGNEGAPALASATISAPPPPPAADPLGRRLTYTYDPATRACSLAWLASPE